jgi:hypothetical protein
MTYYNEGYPSDITPITPQGTNSTMFTECCGVAICNNQTTCPGCNRIVVGYSAENSAERGKIRWKNATRNWDRKN